MHFNFTQHYSFRPKFSCWDSGQTFYKNKNHLLLHFFPKLILTILISGILYKCDVSKRDK